MLRLCIAISVLVTLAAGQLPKSWDWREHGAVTPVQNQGQSGTVLSIVFAEASESLHAIKTGKLVPLSAAELSDCCFRAAGGMINKAAYDCVGSTGLCSAADYPKSQANCGNGTCTAVIHIGGGNMVQAENETAIMEAVVGQPSIAALNALALEEYTGGIVDGSVCQKGQVDHAAVIVGYGTENDVGYWTLKNSWGTSWGEGGYFRVVRGKNCLGVESGVSYPTCGQGKC